ncbi:MAG: SDR family oxidoreductase [Cyanobacteria bacterium]|jgi:NAD(P)-dependent dehydrogenase (short-subunit alcohol dehydrogenase family)|nr:SDR family oxidoreductase [Cyanobacteria bacterium GSL.Bin21]
MKKVVLITGAASGIGYATAQCFTAKGWYVVGTDKKSDESLPGIDCYIQADVSNPQAVRQIINQVKQEIGQLHALVNNAAIQICKPVTEMSPAEWDEVMAVNVRAAFLFSQATHPLLKEAQGSIVNISSVHAVATSTNIAAYATSKGALVSFTRALAIEFAPDQIRVNAVLPGAVNTPMLQAGLERGHLSGSNLDELISSLGKKTVLGRVGQPNEIAEATLFLADNQSSSFMTGQSMIVDGGATARLSTE